MVRRHQMVTVEADPAGVERRWLGGRLACPGCSEAADKAGSARSGAYRGRCGCDPAGCDV
jgi:hypothetical protein